MKRTNIETCPVLALAIEFDKLTRALAGLDEAGSTSDGGHGELESQIIVARLDAIGLQASYMRPISNDGAAFQIMLANALLDAVQRGCTDKIKRESASQMARLFYAAATYLATGDKRLEDATEYLMGSHIDPHAKLVEIEARQ